MERLLERCAPLGDRMGPLLLQLPPTMDAAPDRLAAALDAIPRGMPVAVEPRHASWWHEEVRAVLARHGAALCWADRRGPVSPDWGTAAWRYLRYHEGSGRPWPCYEPVALRPWLERLASEAPGLTDAWVYFNNDPEGCAIADADRFLAMALELGLVPAGPARVSRPAGVSGG